MSVLSDLIAKKKAEILLQQKEEKAEQQLVELALYVAEQSYPLPNDRLFVAAWTPFLKSPFKRDTSVRRDYIRWLLSPSLYVLNTFPKLGSEDLNDLLKAFLSAQRISQPLDLHLLWLLLNDISLMVPLSYKDEFIRVIQGIEEEKIPA